MSEAKQIGVETVTETTPLLGDSKLVPDDAISVAIDPESIAKSVAEVGIDSKVEFHPAVDCNETVVCVEEPASETGERDAVTTENQVELDEHLISGCCCAAYGGPFGYLRVSATRSSQSLYLLPFLFFLQAIPISTGFMGAVYMDRCPMSGPTPLLMFMMGIIGTIIILCRMAIILTKNCVPPNVANDREPPKSIIILGWTALLLFYCTELLCFFRSSPSFELGEINYCDRTFYNFTYYMNLGFLSLLPTVLMLYLPGFVRMCNCHRLPERVESQS